MHPAVLSSACLKDILPDALQIGRVRSNLRRLAVNLNRVEPDVRIQVLEARIRLLLDLCFDRAEIARVRFWDDVPVVRDVERDGVDGPVEYSCPRIGASR